MTVIVPWGFEPPLYLVLTGKGVAKPQPVCPVAVLGCDLPAQTIPQSTCKLSWAKSYSPTGKKIKKGLFTLKGPNGLIAVVDPSTAVGESIMAFNAAGPYELCLDVWDEDNVQSCVPDCMKWLVIPTNALHIELVWDTPTDPDQNDSGPDTGADLDLHFANEFASTLDIDCDGSADPWFSNPWDTFWFNSAPNWGAPSLQGDNPTLDLDDTDGAGPENLNMVAPEGTAAEPMTYRLGVQYWDDHGFGASLATVKIYLYGTLVVKLQNKLNPIDMWYVGKINWPSKAIGGTQPLFGQCYQTGLSCVAKQNLMWQPAGERCVTPCYTNKLFNALANQAPICP
ncbi:MAG: hypothetical protein EXR77_03970 [Myxococcales bacterium]|nr:hypothetical protein [Myxococcales bacterium]